MSQAWVGDQEGLQDFWRIYDDNYEQVLAATLRMAEEHPEFGPIIKLITPEQQKAQNQRSRELLRRAIAGEWAVYEEDLRAQGAMYAQMGIRFSGWYDLVRGFQRELTGLLVKTFGDAPERLSRALNAMQMFVDRAMVVIAEQYLAQTVVLKSEENARLLIDNVKDYAILMLDATGKVMTWNAGAARIKGYRAEEIVGQHFSRFYPPEDIENGKPEMELRVATEQGRFEDEGWRVRKDGSRFWANVVVTALRDRAGALQGFAKVTRDFTERKRTEDEVRRLNIQLSRASRAKSDFLAMMSHELRTPLNSIIGFSEVLIDGKFGALNDKQGRYLQNVHQSGRHLLGLINDLLDLSKIEAGRLEVVRQACATRTLVNEAVATLQPLAESGKVRISIDSASAAVPPISVDAARFKQVLYNLLSNAIKFTPPDGRVVVGLSPAPRPRFVRISVRDSGAGIAAEDLSRLFTPFTQLANARERGGTGLGLALTKQLVELMGGEIGVESEVGKGSTFHVDLPEHVAVVQAPETRPAGMTAAPLAMIVEDDSAAQELLVLALQENGFRTVTVTSGEEAVVQARKQRPDVITLDVFLPTIDGWDVLRLLKSDPDTTHIPVVMVTISSDRGKAFSLGAVEHLVKPVAREALIEALARRSFTTKVMTSPVHVLAIDDDPKQLELFRAALEPRGFQVRTELSGRGGVEAARTGPVDLVLLDLVMPDISGIEVVSELRAQERTRSVPILLITAHELSAAQRERLNGDVQAIVSKGSMRVQDLLDEIGRVLRP